MTGKHEPPSNRSFYISLATSTLRALILVAAVVLGVFVLAKAFPENASSITGTPRSTPRGATEPTQRPTQRPPQAPPASPTFEARVWVLNGTDRTGFAAEMTQRLEEEGYRSSKEPANAPETQRTVIYYRDAFAADARYIRRKFFQGATLRPALPTLAETVDVEVILGSDALSE